MKRILYCKKYRKIIKKQSELEKCLCRFVYEGKCCICPCLIDFESDKPLYKILFSKEESENAHEYWETRNQQWLSLIKTVQEIQKTERGVFDV